MIVFSVKLGLNIKFNNSFETFDPEVSTDLIFLVLYI